MYKKSLFLGEYIAEVYWGVHGGNYLGCSGRIHSWRGVMLVFVVPFEIYAGKFGSFSIFSVGVV